MTLLKVVLVSQKGKGGGWGSCQHPALLFTQLWSWWESLAGKIDSRSQGRDETLLEFFHFQSVESIFFPVFFLIFRPVIVNVVVWQSPLRDGLFAPVAALYCKAAVFVSWMCSSNLEGRWRSEMLLCFPLAGRMCEVRCYLFLLLLGFISLLFQWIPRMTVWAIKVFKDTT